MKKNYEKKKIKSVYPDLVYSFNQNILILEKIIN